MQYGALVLRNEVRHQWKAVNCELLIEGVNIGVLVEVDTGVSFFTLYQDLK